MGTGIGMGMDINFENAVGSMKLGIAFHTTTLENFAIICESIGQFGPELKPPPICELRAPFLKKKWRKERSGGHLEGNGRAHKRVGT